MVKESSDEFSFSQDPIEEDAGYVVCHVCGRISGSVVRLFNNAFLSVIRDLIASKSPQLVILDMSQVSLLASEGVGILISAYKALSQHHADSKLILVDLQEAVRNALSIPKMDDVIDIYEDIDAAVEAISKEVA